MPLKDLIACLAGEWLKTYREDFKMAEITAALVKELRERTGQGMMECKKALVAAGGADEFVEEAASEASEG